MNENNLTSVEKATLELEQFLKLLLEPHFGLYWTQIKRDRRLLDELRYVARSSDQAVQISRLYVLADRLRHFPEYKEAVRLFEARRQSTNDVTPDQGAKMNMVRIPMKKRAMVRVLRSGTLLGKQNGKSEIEALQIA